uniref:Heat shock protein 70 n=1 Tax=Panagrolaimus sp. ES5 TaxID=591445 RepID=A0AC34GG27_9BILA
AAHLSKSFDTSIQNIRLLDVIPRSLGWHTHSGPDDKIGFFQIAFPRNTKFPCETKELASTRVDNQTKMIFKIYEGEDRLVENNKLLGRFLLKNITPAPARVTIIDVISVIDENGIFTVTAVDKQNGSTNSLTILQDKGRLTDNELIKMADEICPPIIEMEIDSD